MWVGDDECKTRLIVEHVRECHARTLHARQCTRLLTMADRTSNLVNAEYIHQLMEEYEQLET